MPDLLPTEEGWVYAAPSLTGRWHVAIDGRACCSAQVQLDSDQMVTVGRAPLRPRCRRPACRSRFAFRVSAATLERESTVRAYAEAAVAELVGEGEVTGNRAMWERQGWLRRHWVYVVAHWDQKVYRVGYTAKADEARRIENRPRPHLVEMVTVPTRFDAQLLQLNVLDDVARWRRELPASEIAKGGSQVWSNRGPLMVLAAAAQRGVRLIDPSE